MKERAKARRLTASAVAVRVGGPPSEWRLRELVDRLTEWPAWQLASQPLAWFVDAFLATRLWPDLVVYALLSVLVNLAVGGKWPGAPVTGDEFPAALDVEYMRVWQK